MRADQPAEDKGAIPPFLDPSLPPLVACRLQVLREKPSAFRRVRINNALMCDEHLPKLMEILFASDESVEEIDLCFNRLTGDGLKYLCELLAREGMMAIDLTLIRFGGNDVSDEAKAAAAATLGKVRPDVVIDYELKLMEPSRLMVVGKVFPDSPAEAAGLQYGDIILALGTMSICGEKPSRAFKSEAERHMNEIIHFADIAESLKPLVTAAVGKDGSNIKEISGVVERDGAHVPIQLRPAQWSGAGLLGAKITAVPLPPKPEKTRSGTFK